MSRPGWCSERRYSPFGCIAVSPSRPVRAPTASCLTTPITSERTSGDTYVGGQVQHVGHDVNQVSEAVEIGQDRACVGGADHHHTPDSDVSRPAASGCSASTLATRPPRP